MLKEDCCHHILKLRGISLHRKLLLSAVNKLIGYIYCLFALKKSEQAEIVAFNRLVVNYNIIFFILLVRTRELVLTVVTRDRKIWNGRTNDFSESCPWILSLLWKENNIYFIHPFITENVELRLIENG